MNRYPSRDEIMSRDSQLLQIVDAAFADSAQRSGVHLVCRPGCTQCCHGAFAINSLDALRLRTGMQTLWAEQPQVAASVERRAAAYIAQFAVEFPGDSSTGILGRTETEQESFEEFANEAPCPALDPLSGLCDLYSARPMTCRVFGPPIRTATELGDEAGLGVCELCFTEATTEEIAASEMRIPRQEEEQLTLSLETTGETIVAYCLVSPID